ncbi:hypothetical protein [Xanthomonas sontii]|uniref:hypothetical protein n=1 Tax=Xanthomonas sontii TaxID=2650745 RepID=UPI0018EFFD62|nr:hypothetical protein [Xanthomonas sontii]
MYSIGKVEHHPEWAEQGMPLVRKVQWQAQELPRDNLGTSSKQPGVDADPLVEHYDATDAEVKRIVPLKRLYWPA